MEIRKISHNKKEFLPLLLLADEQENMIDRYLEIGDMFVLFDSKKAKTVCVVTPTADSRTIEIKNLATCKTCQNKGYAGKMLRFIFDHYKASYDFVIVGTGDSPLTLPFYQHMGFEPSHRVQNFFTDNYDHPIVEDGVLLVDMVYLKRSLK